MSLDLIGATGCACVTSERIGRQRLQSVLYACDFGGTARLMSLDLIGATGCAW